MANTPLKLVYVTPALYMAGGVERVLTLKANYFAEHFGYDITIILTEGKDKPMFYPLSDKIKVVNLDINFEELWTCGFARKVLVYLRKQWQFKRLLTKELMRIRPDITISLLRREINFINDIKDGSKKIGELHVNRANYRNLGIRETNWVKRLFSDFWMRSLVGHLKRLDAFVVLTKADRDSWVELKNVAVIPNPLSFTPPPPDSVLQEKRLIAVGRYSYEKGYDLLLQAWAMIQESVPEWRLEIFGDGDSLPYEKMCDDLRIDRKRCILNGRTPYIIDEYVKSAFAVCSSRFEGFGMVILEAMACGLPVVSFDCPWGPRSIISDGEDGVLIADGDIPKLATAIMQMIEDDQLRQKMACTARHNKTQFRIEYIADTWKILFEEVSSHHNNS